MPENVDGVTKQALKSNQQSVWMAHWMSTACCKSMSKPASNRLSICYEAHKEDGRDLKQDHSVNGSEKSGNKLGEYETRSSEVAETKSARFEDGTMRSSFPMFNPQRKGDAESARKDDRASSSHWESIKPQTDDNDSGYQLFSLGGNEKRLRDLPPMIQWVRDTKPPLIAESSDKVEEKCTEPGVVVSSSKDVPYGFNFGKNRSNSGQHVANSLETYNYTQLLPRDPSTSRNQQPESLAKQKQKIHEHSGVEFFRNKNGPVDLTGPGKYHGCFPSKTLDSMEELSRCHKNFSTSSTAHHFLFASTDFNSIEGARMRKESIVSTKLKEKYSSEPFHISEDTFPIRRGVKLQLLESSAGSEGEKDTQDLRTSSVYIRNESSSETNTTDFDTFRKNHVSGVASSYKVVLQQIELEQQSPKSRSSLDPVREIGGTSHKRKLPDINKQPNEVDDDDDVNSPDTSTSRTQSLDAEHILSNTDQPTNFKFNARPVGFLDSEPSARWLKRLKTSPASASGAHSSKMGEDSSHERVTNIFSKIAKFKMTSSDPVTGSRGKQLAGLVQRAGNLGVKSSATTDSVLKDRKVTLSHPWIRRLRHMAGHSSGVNSKAVPVSESQSPKASMMDGAEKKHFPSLVSMALMGRALRQYNPCKLERKGSSVVWNT